MIGEHPSARRDGIWLTRHRIHPLSIRFRYAPQPATIRCHAGQRRCKHPSHYSCPLLPSPHRTLSFYLPRQRPKICSISYDTLNRHSTPTLFAFNPNAGSNPMEGPFGMLSWITGARYCEVCFHPKPLVVPRPPYISTPAWKFSRQKMHCLFPAASDNGRVTPNAYPNSHASLSFSAFSVMKFSEMFHPCVLLERINFSSSDLSVSPRPCALVRYTSETES